MWGAGSGGERCGRGSEDTLMNMCVGGACDAHDVCVCVCIRMHACGHVIFILLDAVGQSAKLCLRVMAGSNLSDT